MTPTTTAPRVQTGRPARPSRAGAGRLLLLLAVLAAVIVGFGLFTLSRGDPAHDLAGVLEILGGGGERLARITVLQARLPRFVLGVLAGAMLACAGAVLQDSLRNALASPELLGVTSGAAVVVAGIVVLRVPVPFVAYPWLALLGALLAGAVVISTTRTSTDPVRVILIGAALSALLGACVITLITLGGENTVALIYTYLLGDLAARTWVHVRLVAPYALIGIPLALAATRALNLLQLGDDVAAGMGLRVVRARVLLLTLAAALVAAVVAVAGGVPWVALFAPHLARRLLGSEDSRKVLPVAAMLGALLLPGADLLARRAIPPVELPVGLWLTLLGGPFLLVLLRRSLGAPR